MATPRRSAAAAKVDQSVAPPSPGQQRAWIGVIFTAAILVHCALRGSQMVAADGLMASEASAIGGHITMLVVGWLVLVQVLRKRWRDIVDEGERNRPIEARPGGRARGRPSTFVISLALLLLAFSPLDPLIRATPIVISNVLLSGLIASPLFEIASPLFEYAVPGLSHRHDRRGA